MSTSGGYLNNKVVVPNMINPSNCELATRGIFSSPPKSAATSVQPISIVFPSVISRPGSEARGTDARSNDVGQSNGSLPRGDQALRRGVQECGTLLRATSCNKNAASNSRVGSDLHNSGLLVEQHINDETINDEEFNDPTINDETFNDETIITNPINLRGSLTRASNTNETTTLGRGHRTKIPSSKLRDYVTSTVITKNINPSTSSFAPPQSRNSDTLFL